MIDFKIMSDQSKERSEMSANKCRYCGHSWGDHHTLADTPTNADGKPNLPKGTQIPCDAPMANNKD